MTSPVSEATDDDFTDENRAERVEPIDAPTDALPEKDQPEDQLRPVAVSYTHLTLPTTPYV